MWPISVEELTAAIGAKTASPSLSKALINGACTDSRKLSPGDLFVAIHGERIDGHDFVQTALQQGAVAALVDSQWYLDKLNAKGVSSTPSAQFDSKLLSHCIPVPDVLAAFRRVSRFLRGRMPFPVVGIGGSNGKTTTKEMLAAMLGGPGFRVAKTDRSENGFLGIAMTLGARHISQTEPPHALVLEIGIDAPGSMAEHLEIGQPDIVLLTALGPEHLLGLGSWETGICEEMKMLELSPRATRVLQLSDAELRKRVITRTGDVLVGEESTLNEFLEKSKFTNDNQCKLKGELAQLSFVVKAIAATFSSVQVEWRPTENSKGYPVGFTATFELPLPGTHNVDNFALALATSLTLGRTPREIALGWRDFSGPERRSRVVPLGHDCTLLDDCYNASPSSVKAAIQAIKHPDWCALQKILILGDMLELGAESAKWHEQISEELSDLQNAKVFLYGDEMEFLYKKMSQQSFHHPFKLLEWIPRASDPTTFVAQAEQTQNCLYLVKGSNGMNLNRIVKILQEKLPSVP